MALLQRNPDELPENVGFQRHSRAQLLPNTNVFGEWVWRGVEYEEAYLNAYESLSQARQSIAVYMSGCNQRQPHSSLKDRTPDEACCAVLPAIDTAAQGREVSTSITKQLSERTAPTLYRLIGAERKDQLARNLEWSVCYYTQNRHVPPGRHKFIS